MSKYLNRGHNVKKMTSTKHTSHQVIKTFR